MVPEGAVAQLGERLVRIEKVRGSIPLGSTIVKSRDIVHSMSRDFLCVEPSWVSFLDGW